MSEKLAKFWQSFACDWRRSWMPTVFGSWVISSKHKSAPLESAAGLFAQAKAVPAPWVGAALSSSWKMSSIREVWVQIAAATICLLWNTAGILKEGPHFWRRLSSMLAWNISSIIADSFSYLSDNRQRFFLLFFNEGFLTWCWEVMILFWWGIFGTPLLFCDNRLCRHPCRIMTLPLRCGEEIL